MYINSKDIALRLFRRKPFWFDGPPNVALEGEPGKFGWLVFNFPYYEKQKFRMYFPKKGRSMDEIFAMAKDAIANFSEIINEAHKE